MPLKFASRGPKALHFDIQAFDKVSGAIITGRIN